MGGSTVNLVAIDFIATGLEHQLYFSAALGIVSVDHHLNQWGGNGGLAHMLQVHYIGKLLVLLQPCDGSGLHFVEIKPLVGNGLAVEVNLVAVDAGHQFFGRAKLFREMIVKTLFGLLGEEPVGRYAMVAHHQYVVGGSVVGGKEHEILSFAHFFIEEREEISKTLVKVGIDGHILFMVSAIFMPHHVGARKAHGEHVSDVVSAESLTLYGSFGHLFGQAVAQSREAHRVFGHLADGLVVTLKPFGQLFHIIRTGDEMAVVVVIPESTICSMSGRENGGTVFERNAIYLALEVGGHLQFIADGGGQEPVGRFHATLVVGAHALHLVVFAAINLLSVFHEIVGGNAMDGRHRTGENRGMSHAGDRWDVVDHGVLAAVALVEHSFETTLTIQVIVAVEIIPTHLVNNDAHYEFGAVQASCHGLCAADECHDSQQCPSTCSKKMSFHDGFF